ncbi:MAG: hypothetical protein JWO30_4292 [Fibrobacteres bacterium]|nr:hypothetical protein [Fibrobacterota bacterium]
MFETEFSQFENHARIVCKGKATLENLKGVVDRIKDGEFGNGADSRYLIDLRPIVGTLSTFERYDLGIHIAATIPKFKIAAISKKETHDKMGENVAVNRGANILATDDEAEAMDWLLQ